MNTQTKHTSLKYTLDFKQDAAGLVNENGYSCGSSWWILEYDLVVVQGRTKTCRGVVKERSYF